MKADSESEPSEIEMRTRRARKIFEVANAPIGPKLPAKRLAVDRPILPAILSVATVDRKPDGFQLEIVRLLQLGTSSAVDEAVALIGPRTKSMQEISSDVNAVLDNTQIPEATRRRFRARLFSELSDRDSEYDRERKIASKFIPGLYLGGLPTDHEVADDVLRKCRVFELDERTVREVLSASQIEDVRSPYLLAPFPYFCIIPSVPIAWSKEPELSICSIWVDASTDEWIVYARVTFRNENSIVQRGLDLRHGEVTGHAGENTIDQLIRVQRFVDTHIPILAPVIRNSISEKLSMRAFALKAPILSIALGFSLALNSRNVHIEAVDPRDAVVHDQDIDGDGPRRKRPRYRIVIRDGTRLAKHVLTARRGHETHNRRPHSVRKHLRELTDGRVVSVRAHNRCGDPGLYLPLYEMRGLPQPIG